MLLFFVG